MSPRILLVEDDDDIASALELRLQAKGYEVERLAEPSPVLPLVRADAPDLLMLDITLPGEDGLSVARRLDDDMGARRPPILFLTASLREEIAEGVAELERTALMQNPFKANELLEAIEGSLSMGP